MASVAMTPPPGRRDARRDHRAFPRSYEAFVKRFADEGRKPIALGPMSRRDAEAARRDLYRYKLFLTNADPDDADARRLADVFSDAQLVLEPTATEDTRGDTLLVMRLNPVAAALGGIGASVDVDTFDWKG